MTKLNSLGGGAAASAGVAALLISQGTTNAFVASIARLAYSLGCDGWLPPALARISGREVPSVGIALVAGIGAVGIVLSWLCGWGTQDIVAIPSTLVIATYLVGTAAGVRLLSGPVRVAPLAAFVLTLCTVPFALTHVLVPLVIAAVALGYRQLRAANRVDGATP